LPVEVAVPVTVTVTVAEAVWVTVTAAQVPDAVVDKAAEDELEDEVEAGLVDEGETDVLVGAAAAETNSYNESLHDPPHIVLPLASPRQGWVHPVAVKLLAKVSLTKQAPPFCKPNNFRPAALPILAH
jgi:hypothetical protein